MIMKLRKASLKEFEAIKKFYWNLIDEMSEKDDSIGWKKGIYPSDQFLEESLSKGELFNFVDDGPIVACVILNSDYNDGYIDVSWGTACEKDEVLIPHALGVCPNVQGRGIGSALVEEIIKTARTTNKKVIRLDILDGNLAAEKLYTKCGFQFVEEKTMFYEDTGWTKFKMYEQVL